MDLAGLRVGAVQVDGVPAGVQQTPGKVVVTPAGGLRAGQGFELRLDYAGEPRPVDGVGWLRTRTGSTVLGEPDGSRAWFPVNERPDDKATYDVSVDVPAGVQAVGNGIPSGAVTAAGRTTWRWVEDRPIAPYLAGVSVGRSEIAQGTSAGFPSFTAIDRTGGGFAGFPRRGPLRRADLRATRRLLAQAGPTVRRLERLFGPYPFATVGGTYVRILGFGQALETSSRPTYYGFLDADVQAHELAHQWVGDAVTLRHWRDVWLHEGFATWAQWWEAGQRPGGASPRALARGYAAVPRAAKRLWRHVIPRRARDLFGPAVCTRGALTLEALRQRIGGPAFRRLLRAWLDGHRYGTVHTADFEALAERISGQQLDGFFDAWLRSPGKPRLARRLR